MLPFSSLRNRMIVAFAAVIALSLLLTSGAFVYMLRDYQAQREKDRLDLVARNASALLIDAIRHGASPSEVEDQLEQVAAQSGARILLMDDRGTIVRDTDEDRLVNRQFPLPPAPTPSSGGRRIGAFQGTIVAPGGDSVYTVVPFGPPTIGFRVAVIAPEQSLTDAWRELLPRLSIAALGSLLVSIALALWLASTITRPVAQITRAADEMAHGNYDQEIPEPESGDEIGRLARAFNGMATEVGRSHRAMRDLLANVSHDLRTPLTSIQGFAGALVDGTLAGAEGAREAGQVICEEAERMRRLVEDLLYLGRIESGEVTIERHTVDLSDLVRAAQLRFTFRAEEAGIALRTEAVGRVLATGDSHRLTQVLDNLLDNAFKHTPTGGEIVVSTRVERGPAGSGRSARPGARAVMAVHNSGSVISPDELDRVFERFYQLDKSRTSPKGRGLGLSIAREIIQAHGGSITASSKPEAGTTFTVTLPLLEVAPETRVSSVGSRGVDPVGVAAATPRR